MKYQPLTDSSLINLLKEGDERAFKEIYLRYWKDIYKTACVKIHHKELAEEFTQNLFVDLWKRRQTIYIESLSSYLFGSLKYSIINHYKSQLVKQKYQDHLSTQPLRSTNSTDELVLLRDLSNALDEGIALLPKKTAQVFKLSRIENRSTKEISRELNISEKSVEYHITQSIKAMRFHLKEHLIYILVAVFYLI